MVRIFIAIDLPPAIKEQIQECQSILSTSRAKLTLVNPSSVHITLKFIGEVDPVLIEPISQALKKFNFEPFNLSIERIGTNNPRSPRVIWGNVVDSGKCVLLHHDIETILAPFGIPNEPRPFTPHMTIARVKNFHPSLLETLKKISDMNLGGTTVNGIILKKSTLRPEGPLYENLCEVVWN